MLQPSESLYDQKPEEPKPAAPVMTTSTTKSGPSLHSRFEYVENEPAVDSRNGGTQMTGHVAPPKSSNFFQEYGMDNGFQKKTSTAATKTQVNIEPMFVLCQ
jgi:ADP-ribosylation factor GTPase-activating protein 2/3